MKLKNEFGELVKWYCQGKTEELGGTGHRATLSTTNLTRGLAWCRTKVSGMRGRKITNFGYEFNVTNTQQTSSYLAVNMLQLDDKVKRTSELYCNNVLLLIAQSVILSLPAIVVGPVAQSV